MFLDQRYKTKQIPPRNARTLLLCYVLGVPLLVALIAIAAIDPSHRLPPPTLIHNTVYTSNFTLGFGLIASLITIIAGASICLRLHRITVVQL